MGASLAAGLFEPTVPRMRPIVLRIAGRASTKQRPRFDPRTKRTYTPPSNIVSENDVRAVWREAGEPRIEDDVAITLDVTVTVMRPAGHFRRDGSLSAEGRRHPVPRTQKPDLDNAVKLVMDALNTRAYRDDVRIARIAASRRWGDWPETLVILAPIERADRIVAPVEFLSGVERSVGPGCAPAPVASTDGRVGVPLNTEQAGATVSGGPA